MIVRRLVMVLSVVAVGSLALAAAAFAAGGGFGPGKYSFNSTSAYAEFGSGKGGPPAPSVSVYVNQGYNSFQPMHPKGPRIVTNSTMVQFSQFDPVTGDGGFGCFVVPAGDFTVGRDLQTAALHTTLTADETCPGFGTPVAASKDVTAFAGGGGGVGLTLPITVDVTWSGNGVVSTSQDKSTFQCLTYKEDGNSSYKDSSGSASGSTSVLSGLLGTDFADVSTSVSSLDISGTAQPPCFGY
jgi:hypothetical protein